MEIFSPEAIRRDLQTRHVRLLGKPLHYWPQVDSTNATLFRLLKDGAEEGAVVVADAQTSGQGRLGKPWFSPHGLNVYLSVLLKPPIHLSEARVFTLIGSLAIADGLDEHNIESQVKWPNDVLVGAKKIGGVLTEVQAQDGDVAQLILGIGVNVNIDRPTMDRLYGEAAAGATSVREVLGHTIDRTMFVAQLLEKVEKRYERFMWSGKDVLLDDWKKRSFLGQRVRVTEDERHVEGVAMDLDDEGCLVVRLDDGLSIHVREGEVAPWDKGANH